jgi:hypothetical protein
MKGFTTLQILDHRHGRLGNQLFRVATIIGQAIKNNSSFFVPSEWEHAKLFPNLPTRSSVKIKSNISLTHKESKFGIHNIPTSDKLVEIVGYFQSSLFFDDYEKKVLEYLVFDPTIIEKVNSKMNQNSKKLSIHIRWGDQYDRKFGGGHKGVEHRHPVLTLEYYQRSIEDILSKKSIDEICIFTDNEDTKEFIFGKFEKYQKPITYFDYSDDYISDFIAQSLCDHFIIANSTFSWWAAYLSKSTDKLVYCPYPDEWFGPDYQSFDTNALTPERWIKIRQK